MNKNYLFLDLLNKLRDVTNLPGLVQLKYLARHLQAQARRNEFDQMQHLVDTLPLGKLLAQQPRFPYKYLGSYSATSFSRPMRLAAILNHYQFLAEAVRPEFFSQLVEQPIVWEEYLAGERFAIALSYPIKASFEGELSLNFYRGTTIIQMMTCVIVPGDIVGGPVGHTLLVSQVQGTPHTEAIRLTTKQLHDITPASLLINAAYGLAAALGIGHGAGVSSHNQLGRGAKCYFDYDAFWQQFRGEQLASQFYLLDLHAPEKPIEEIKAKYRPRTLRKRAYKQQLRQAVEAAFQAHFMPVVTTSMSQPYLARCA